MLSKRHLNRLNGTLIAVSHDRYFLNRLFTKTLWLEQTPALYHGPYAYAVSKHGCNSLLSLKRNTSPSNKKLPKPITFDFSDANAHGNWKRSINQTEQELHLLESATGTGNGLRILTKLFDAREELVHQLDDLYEQFLALE